MTISGEVVASLAVSINIRRVAFKELPRLLTFLNHYEVGR